LSTSLSLSLSLFLSLSLWQSENGARRREKQGQSEGHEPTREKTVKGGTREGTEGKRRERERGLNGV
jgi:hypothetical protein